ncbi:Mpp10 protein-domain-containing protein [Boletus edulis]|nr:Mpp10 protein-domain-containing protein [Boletus edulis]
MPTHEQRLAGLQSEIQALEAGNVAPKEWTLLGEASARSRPHDSLLSQDLEFDRTTRTVPIVTEAVIAALEERIKARIKEGRFDDVERRRPVGDTVPFLPSRVVELQIPSRRSRWRRYTKGLSDIPTASLESALPFSRSFASILAPEEVLAPTSPADARPRSELNPAEKRARRVKERKARKKVRDALNKTLDRYASKKRKGNVKEEKEAALKSLVKFGKGVARNHRMRSRAMLDGYWKSYTSRNARLPHQLPL